jgi:hypothetical protein
MTERSIRPSTSSHDARARLLITCLQAIAMLAIPSLASSQNAPQESADSNVVKLIRDVGNGQTNPMATAMFSAGVRNCATRVDQVGNFLTKNTKSSALVFLPEKEPDNSMISVSMEIQGEAIPRAYASATFSPNTPIGCAAEYETVQYWPEPCNTVALKQFKGATPQGSLGTEIAVLAIGPLARVFLMRATGTSCVSIKKELLR